MKVSHNKIIALIVFVGIFGCMTKKNENKEFIKKETKMCNIKFEDFAIRGEKGSLQNLYVKVDNYNAKDSTCKKAIYENFQNQKKGFPYTICVNYMDSIDFDPPRNGKTFGSEALQNKVIVQMIVLNSGAEQIYYDPFGTGKY